MIRLDVTPHSVVVVCSQCPWRALAGDRAGGWALGAAHDAGAHDAPVSATSRQLAARHRNI